MFFRFYNCLNKLPASPMSHEDPLAAALEKPAKVSIARASWHSNKSRSDETTRYLHYLCLVLYIQNPQTTLYRPATTILLHQHRSLSPTNYIERQTFHHEIYLDVQAAKNSSRNLQLLPKERCAPFLWQHHLFGPPSRAHGPPLELSRINPAQTREAQHFA